VPAFWGPPGRVWLAPLPVRMVVDVMARPFRASLQRYHLHGLLGVGGDAHRAGVPSVATDPSAASGNMGKVIGPRIWS
jgi:hypothetical protein